MQYSLLPIDILNSKKMNKLIIINKKKLQKNINNYI